MFFVFTMGRLQAVTSLRASVVAAQVEYLVRQVHLVSPARQALQASQVVLVPLAHLALLALLVVQAPLEVREPLGYLEVLVVPVAMVQWDYPAFKEQREHRDLPVSVVALALLVLRGRLALVVLRDLQVHLVPKVVQVHQEVQVVPVHQVVLEAQVHRV